MNLVIVGVELISRIVVEIDMDVVVGFFVFIW